MDYLKVFGVRILIIAFDADKHTNARVMQSQIRTIETLHAEGFQIGLAEWDGAYRKRVGRFADEWKTSEICAGITAGEEVTMITESFIMQLIILHSRV